jgi:ceramide glucosyltransferase
LSTPGILLETASWTALVWSMAVLFIGLVAFVLRWRLGRKRDAGSTEAVRGRRLLLVRPCAGAEPSLERCLLSVLDARRDFELEVVMAVDHAGDEALEAIEVVRGRLEQAGLRADVEVHPQTGPNRKASLLAAVTAERAGRYPVIINADSNTDLAGVDLNRLVAPLLRGSGLGATWSPHSEVSPHRTPGNRASIAVLGGSLHSFELLCAIDPSELVGKLFAVRSDALREVGGFTPLTEYLGEDIELSRRLLRAGYGVRPVLTGCRSVGGRRRLGEVIRRHQRWIVIIRAQRPALLWTYPVFFCCGPVPVALAAAGSLVHPVVAILSVAAFAAGRVIAALAAARYSGRRPGPLRAAADLLLSEIVLTAAFVRAILSRRLEWRGRRLRVGPGARLRHG